jgi:hypothetical protein
MLGGGDMLGGGEYLHKQNSFRMRMQKLKKKKKEGRVRLGHSECVEIGTGSRPYIYPIQGVQLAYCHGKERMRTEGSFLT